MRSTSKLRSIARTPVRRGGAKAPSKGLPRSPLCVEAICRVQTELLASSSRSVRAAFSPPPYRDTKVV